MPRLGDTIAALASAPGQSPRALLRVSGPQTHQVVHRWIGKHSDQPPATPWRPTPVTLIDPPLPALLTVFAKPKSFTGEDVAELQLPGHPALVDRLLAQAYDAGARPADPGEFTYRAVRHGKLTAYDAEALAAAIAAQSQDQLAAADRLKRGGLARPVRQASAQLTTLRALVEAGIDFAEEEDVHPIAPADLAQQSRTLAERLAALAQPGHGAAPAEAHPRIVLAGPVGAGKSSLFNRLLQQPRAVVDPEHGTTRDALEEPLTLRHPDTQAPIQILLVDTAGWHGPGDALDRKALAATRRALRHADVVLWCDAPPSHFDIPQDVRRALSDSATALYAATQRDRDDHDTPPAHPEAIPVSAHTGRGLDTLLAILARAAADPGQAASTSTLVLPRHQRALERAAHALNALHQDLAPITGAALPDPELIAQRLADAATHLDLIVGRVLPDDVLGHVFAGFCVGK
ncbi:MAG: GTPase [Planctomycetota bacterium]